MECKRSPCHMCRAQQLYKNFINLCTKFKIGVDSNFHKQFGAQNSNFLHNDIR
jgi:hypothetical protein